MKKTRLIIKSWHDRLIKKAMAREKKVKVIRDQLKDQIIRDI